MCVNARESAPLLFCVCTFVNEASVYNSASVCYACCRLYTEGLNMDAKSFGAFIADQRRTLGLTQAEVAARLHVTDKAVSRWERGVGLPDINTLEPLAQVWQGFCYVRTALQFCGMSAHRSSLLPTPQSSLSFLLRHCCNVWRYFSGTFVMPIYHFGKRNFLHGSVLFSPGFRNLSGFCAKPCSSSFLAL